MRSRPFFAMIALCLLGVLVTASLVRAQERSDRDSRRESRGSWRTSERNDGQGQRAADGFTERYGMLVESNMFLRDRRTASPEPSTQPSAPPPSPEQTMMLTGIVFEDGGFRAYFENLRESRVVRVSPGDAIATGHVSAILIDALEYFAGSESRWIEIGQDLTGKAAAVAPGGGSSASSTTAPTTTFSPDVDPASLSPADRLRLRRQQELQGR